MENNSIKVIIKIDGNEYELGQSFVDKNFIDAWESIKKEVPSNLFGKIISHQFKNQNEQTTS